MSFTVLVEEMQMVWAKRNSSQAIDSDEDAKMSNYSYQQFWAQQSDTIRTET